MPFDINSAKPATAPGFNRATAQPATAPGFVSREQREQRIRDLEAERAALPNPNTPVRNYLKEWGGAVKGAFAPPETPEQAAAEMAPGALPEAGMTMLTGLTSGVTGPAQQFLTDIGLIPGSRDLAETRESQIFKPQHPGAQRVLGQVGALFKPVGDLLSNVGPQTTQYAEEFGADPATAKRIGDTLSIGTELGLEALPAGRGMPRGRTAAERVGAEEMGKMTKPATRREEVARAAGVSVLPSSVPGRAGTKGKVLERVSGSPQAAVNFSVKNEPRLQAHARQELGLQGDAKLTPGELENVRRPHEKVYDEVRETVPVLVGDEALNAAIAGIGGSRRTNELLEVAPSVNALRERLANVQNPPSSSDVLAAIRDWRQKARVLYKSADDPAKHDQAAAYQEAANAFEDALERAATAQGKGDLGQRFRDARRNLAKINDVEDALVDGMVNIGEFAKMQKAGKKLTGRLEMLADIGRWFERETQHTSGLSMPEHQSAPLMRIMLSRAAQAVARGPIDDILANEFGRYQRQFGDVDPNPGPGSPLGAYFEAPPAPRPQPGPAGPFGAGSVDFSGSPDVPPQAALRPGERIEFARDEAGDAAFPAAGARMGDLTAEQAPAPRGDIDFQPSPEIMNVQGPRAPAPIGNDIAGSSGGFFPGEQVPPNAALVEWLTDQPLERRRQTRDLGVEQPNPPFQGDSTRPFPDDGTPPTVPGRPGDPDVLELAPEYPVPDRSTERARVLGGDAMNVDDMLGDLFARFPDLEREVRGDTAANAQVAMNRRIEDRGGKRQPRGPTTPRRRRDDPDADEEGEGAPVAPKKPPEGGEGGAAASLGDLFHGTGARFSNFDPSRIGSNTGNPTTRLGVSLASTLEDAQHYARLAAEKGGEPQVMRVKADVQRPYQMTARELDQLAMKLMEGEDVATAAVEQLRERLVAESYDSIVVSTPRNPQKEVIVFDANKVKRAPLFDPRGAGGVPDSQNIGYMGFERTMTPDEFLGLAERIPPGQERTKSLEFLRNLANEGGQFGNPFLSGARWDEAAKVWRVRGQHEGRHRTMVARERGEREIPVHVFPGEGLRARDLTDEMRNAPILWKDETAGPLAGLGDEFERVMPAVEERLGSYFGDESRRFVPKGEGQYPDSSVIMAPIDNGAAYQVKSAYVDPAKQGQGVGQQLLMEAVEAAVRDGKPLFSDANVSAQQARVYLALERKGQIKFDTGVPREQIEAAIAEGRNINAGSGRAVFERILPVKRGG